jgi:hypothetical protein
MLDLFKENHIDNINNSIKLLALISYVCTEKKYVKISNKLRTV